MRKAIFAFVLSLSVLLLSFVFLLYTNVNVLAEAFIDCPDCNNGHSPACKCGGTGYFYEECSICNSEGKAKCDLCGGSGSYEEKKCNRCGGSGQMTCTRCNGTKQEKVQCRVPVCPRCEGHAYHILNEEGTVEYLGEAEFIKDEDGNVTEVAFVTRGFSDFFITSEIIDIQSTALGKAEGYTKSLSPAIYVIVIIAVLGVLTLLYFMISKKKANGKTIS